MARSTAGQSLRASGLVKDVADIYTKEDAARCGNFTPVPCKRGEVRVTRPEIIHGSTATARDRAFVACYGLAGLLEHDFGFVGSISGLRLKSSGI